jgi:glutamate-1-semialdehyde aminotransferase
LTHFFEALSPFWPAFFPRAKGFRAWDLNGHELIDMSIMGIGTTSSATAIAIRIARAATGRDTVAICGYHR